MNHHWGYPQSSFQTHENQQSCYLPYQQCFDSRKYSTRAYVNPHVANYEHIKRSLTKAPLLGINKIHVNPNFKGHQEQQRLDFNNVIYPNYSYPAESKDATQPGTSKTSTYDEKVNSSAIDTNTKVPLSKFRFRKVNPIKTKYSWCKSGNINEPPKSNSRTFLKSSKICKKPVLGLNKYKFIASKKAKTQTPEKTTSRIYLSKTKIINKSKTKLVNNSQRKIVKVFSPVKTPFYNYEIRNKKSNILLVAKAVMNKYKYFNSPRQSRNLKYKIDKRIRVDTLKRENTNRVRDISKLFPSNFHMRHKHSHQSYDGAMSKNISLQRKNLLTQVHHVVLKSFPNKRVVKIGGILYKTTTNKLTLAKNKEQKKQSQPKASNHVVYVRGEKFLLENNGKTLRRQPKSIANEKSFLQALRRIDIGGVTYIQKSKNVLVRTNVHQAQYVLNKAKNKSIAILMNLRKRSTMPCMIYHRFGKCTRHNKGLCMYKHDPKNISICKLFLKGDCKKTNCLLSHQAIPEKMATCHFFLNGFCDRDNCPFPHVKLNKNVAICEKFLQGFCNLGKECTKRHLHLCPNFDKFGSCSLGSKCHYPHKVPIKKQNASETISKANENNEKVQYFIHSEIRETQGKMEKSEIKEESKKGVKKKLKMADVSWADSDQCTDSIKCVPKRIKLDKLPCYIPLQKDA